MKNNTIYYRSVYYVITLCLFCLFGYVFFLNGVNGETKVKVYYQRGSLVNYKINYDEDKKIDNIDINYAYKSVFSEDVNVKYDYSVTAYLHAYQDNINDIVWFRRYDLVKDDTFEVYDSSASSVDENIKLDYKSYKKELDFFTLSLSFSLSTISSYTIHSLSVLLILNFCKFIFFCSLGTLS